MSERSVLVEACVESLEEALTAERAGADRLELCDNLAVGGTTPRSALLAAVKQQVRIPVAVMVRPRGGSFVFSRVEVDSMYRDIAMAQSLGADALVIGVLDAAGRVDAGLTRSLVARAKGIPVTFHRAFDEVTNQRAALDALIGAGVSRVLTSGGAATAIEGADALAELVRRAAGRIRIMAGGKVRGVNVRELVTRSGVEEVHARSELDESRIRDIIKALSF